MKFHPALTFISSLLCAGGCICYWHSVLRTGVYDKNTSPNFISFLFSSFQWSPKHMTLSQNLHQWPCLGCTAAEYSQVAPVFLCNWGSETFRAFPYRDSSVLSPQQLQRGLLMGTPQVWTPKFSKLFGTERKTGAAFTWGYFYFVFNKRFVF